MTENTRTYKEIQVGDTVHTRRYEGFKGNTVTQVIDSNGTTILILDSGRFALSINAALLEWHNNGWFEKEHD